VTNIKPVAVIGKSKNNIYDNRSWKDTSKMQIDLKNFNQIKPFTYLNYWVLDTDYDTYSLVYSCNKIRNAKIETAWILGRTRHLEDEVKNILKEMLDSNAIDSNKFITTDHSDCN
jgi:apolipoprotein D and lipocalin family protein